ncbi:COX assembly mitochondrial protein 2 homolog isoform X2 [Rhodnius prolixus]|uniref:COX assembly mitochondrial protein 2 homolog isoform X2 n=1 Tax=Rhodnius prolixus TaxID=13249 RepID=UPI003D18D426
MHPDLSPHLHTEECNILISKLKDCHTNVRHKNKISKFFGACSEADRELLRCLKKEREANRKKNAEEGERRREAMRQKMSSAATS